MPHLRRSSTAGPDRQLQEGAVAQSGAFGALAKCCTRRRCSR